jgi:uncharacterized small protein (TIGR04563 family)
VPSSSPKKKVTLYFSAAMLEETQREAIRQDRSISWIIQAAWRISREDVHKLPNVGGLAASVALPADAALPTGAALPPAAALPAAALPAAALPTSATSPASVPPAPRLKARN